MAQGELFSIAPDTGTEWLGDRCCLQRDGDLVLIVIGGAPLLRYQAGDAVYERLAAALIAEAGAAPIGRVQEAFGIDDATLWRARKRLKDDGIMGLVPSKRGPTGRWKVQPALERRIIALRRGGHTQEWIGARLHVSQSTVHRVLEAAGELDGVPEEMAPLPFEVGVVDAAASVKPASCDQAASCAAADTVVGQIEIESTAIRVVAPQERANLAAAPEADGERMPEPVTAEPPTQVLAAVEALRRLSPDGEARPVLESRPSVPEAGLLLALPAVERTGLFEACREVYGKLSAGLYGLRATVLVLVALALLRRPRPEALVRMDPVALGSVLGLLRAPEVKTVRTKLTEISEAGKAHELLRRLAVRWLREREDLLGLLYVDGHVRVYNGKQTLPKAHVTQRNLAMPATTDYWVNDAEGSPLFVMTAQANAAMTKVLPPLLKEMEELAGGHKGTVVFDRGGWSLALFTDLVGAGWRILTYRKGKIRKHRRAGFAKQTMTIDGREVSYTLSERRVRLRGGLELREIAVLRDKGRQTLLLSNDFESPAVLLAYRLFERWRQENFFRYMKENFALDALADYDVEFDDPARDVPNPARKRLDKKLAKARARVAQLEQVYGAAAADNDESKRPTMRGFKIANGEIGKQLRASRGRVQELRAARRKLPERVPVGAIRGSDAVVRLSPERHLFTDAIKAATYRAETALRRLLRRHFTRADDEGRAFLRDAVKLPGTLIVEGNNVTVRLARMGCPRFTRVLRHLCEELNALAMCFPETSYLLRYEVND